MKLRIKMGFDRNRSCLSLNSRKQNIQSTFLSVLEYGNFVCMNATDTLLKSLDAVYHSAILGLNTAFSTRKLVGSRRLIHLYVFIFKALLQKVPPYLTSLLNFRHASYHTWSQGWLTLEIPLVSTGIFQAS